MFDPLLLMIGRVIWKAQLAICPTTVVVPFTQEVLGYTLKLVEKQSSEVSPLLFNTPIILLTAIARLLIAQDTVAPFLLIEACKIAQSGLACTCAEPTAVMVLQSQHWEQGLFPQRLVLLPFAEARQMRTTKMAICCRVINYYKQKKTIFRLKLAQLRFTQNQPQRPHLICTLAETWTFPQGTLRIFYWKEQQFALIPQGIQLSAFWSTMLTTEVEFLPLSKRYSASLNSASATAALRAVLQAKFVLEF